MQKDMLEYQGYRTRVSFDAEAMQICGKVEGLKDEVWYSCESAADVEKAFHQAVDDYLAACAREGRRPGREYKGVFNVRIRPELHRALAEMASESRVTLNYIIEQALSDYVKRNHA